MEQLEQKQKNTVPRGTIGTARAMISSLKHCRVVTIGYVAKRSTTKKTAESTIVPRGTIHILIPYANRKRKH